LSFAKEKFSVSQSSSAGVVAIPEERLQDDQSSIEGDNDTRLYFLYPNFFCYIANATLSKVSSAELIGGNAERYSGRRKVELVVGLLNFSLANDNWFIRLFDFLFKAKNIRHYDYKIDRQP
jgi:hypothetical protein